MSNQSTNNGILLAILWPFAGLISAIRNWRQPWAMNVFWLVCVYMGLIFIYQEEGTILGSGADGGRYVLELQRLHSQVSSFSEIAHTFYNGSTNDVFAPILLFLVSRLTDNGHVFFLILSIIYGYFYSRNIWYIIKYIPEGTNNNLWIVVSALFLVCPIWNINGVRMWTALHVFCYGAFPYLLEGKKKKLIWCISSILIHHSFIFPIILILLFALLLRRVQNSNLFLFVFLSIYLFSLSVKALNLEIISSYLQSYLPTYYDGRIETYVNEDYLERNKEAAASLSNYIHVFEILKFWSVQTLIIISFVSVVRFKDKSNWIVPLFSFSLLMSSFGNMASNVPSGGRFLVIAEMFLFASIILVRVQSDSNGIFNFINSVVSILIAIELLFEVRKGFDYYGLDLIFGNFLTAMLIEVNVPMIYYVKMIF